MDEEQKNRIEKAVLILEPTAQEDAELLDFTIETAVDRVLLFLRAENLNPRLEKVIAQIVAKMYRKTAEAKTAGGETKRDIKSLSDNGQSITYTDTPAQYLANATDQELFEGFAELLSRYRRVNVVRKK